MEAKKKLVIFDFDGVLINTLELSYEINREVNDWLTFDEYKDMSNGNFHEKLEEAVKHKGYQVPENFFEHYEKGIFKIDIHDILHDAVLHLADKYTLVIVTSSHGEVVSNFIKKENLEGCFAEILGYEFHKSKVTKINYLLDKYKLRPNETIFITDTLGDIREGHECQVPMLAVTWGLHTRDILEKGNPEFIIDNPQDLAPVVEKVLC